jgi:hypothetical protein
MIDKTRKTISVWWPKYPKPGNFGDIITPWLIKNLFGLESEYSPHPISKPSLIATGSIIRMSSPLTTVWGSGVMRVGTKCDPNAQYLAVRGPITHKVLHNNGIYKEDLAYGDPALLSPIIYKKHFDKKYKIGIFPHYVDYDMVYEWYKNNKDVKVINALNADVTKVIDDVMHCEKIISSSLHGLIISNAYGIPSSWVKFSNKLSGDDSKFFDYYKSVSIDPVVIDVKDKLSEKQMNQLIFSSGLGDLNLNKLIKAFPYDSKFYTK